MAQIKDLLEIIANKGDKPLVIYTRSFPSPADLELERQLRELKCKQDLRKDWILFIVRDVVIFSTAIVFIFAVSSYSLFILINR